MLALRENDCWFEAELDRTKYGYDALGNLTNHSGASQVFSGPLSGPHAIDTRTVGTDLYTYTYDDDGNCITESGPSGTKHLGFDSKNRLDCVGSAAGLCNTMRVYYDAAGSRVRATVATGEYTYVDNVVTLHDEPGVGPERWTDFHIWAFGEEIARYRIDGVPLRSVEVFSLPRPRWGEPVPWLIVIASAGAILALLIAFMPWAESARREPAGATLAVTLSLLLFLPPTTVRAGGGGDGATRYRDILVADRIGSVGAIVAEDGSLVREVVHKPFGGVYSEAGSGRNGAGDVYAGHRSADEVGLYYMRARWQNPETGQFLSVDPVVPSASDPQSLNAYTYARNNPARFVDPTGTSFDCYGNCGNPSDAPPGWNGWNASVSIYTATAALAPGVTVSWTGQVADLPPTLRNSYNADGYPVTVRHEGVSFEGYAGGQGFSPGGGGAPYPHLDKAPAPTAAGGTFNLWGACTRNVAGACSTLDALNQEDLEDALGYIGRADPDLLSPIKDELDISFDGTPEFVNARSGTTRTFTGRVILARAYPSKADLVNTVAHELQHVAEGIGGRILTRGQDLLSPTGLGPRHQAIYGRADRISGSYRP